MFEKNTIREQKRRKTRRWSVIKVKMRVRMKVKRNL